MSIKKLCTGSHTQPIMNIQWQRKGNNIGIPSLIFFSLICDSRLFTTIDKSCSSFPDSPLPSPSMLTYELLKFGKINGWYGIIPENDPAGRGRGGSDGLSAFCISVKFCKKKEYPVGKDQSDGFCQQPQGNMQKQAAAPVLPAGTPVCGCWLAAAGERTTTEQ